MMRKKSNTQRYVGGTTFAIISALFFTLFTNTLFYTRAWDIVLEQNDSWHVILFCASMPIVVFSLLNIIFSVLFLPWIRKPILILFLLTGAAVNYFMYSFNVVIDMDMIDNALQTNVHETRDLITFNMGVWLLFLGIIPATWVVWVKIKATPWWKALFFRSVNIIVSALIVVLMASFFYKDYASLFRNHRDVIKRLVPSNAVAGLIQVMEMRIDANRPFIEIGTDAKKGEFIQSKEKKTLMILVVGEAARAENFSLGSYERETNPLLGARNDVIWFDHVSSCGTATAISIPCMFSNMTRRNYSGATARHQSGVLDILHLAGVDIMWRENDGGCKGVCDRVPNIDVTRLNIRPYCQGGACLDEILFYQLEEHLNGLNDDSLVVLHQMGSHGPSYHRRYTPEFRKFTPTCDTNAIQNCDRQSLVNTYDNTIVYTDFILDSTIKLLEKYDDKFDVMMLYVSDHGESLGEMGMYLHGAPYALAPSQQTHIPQIIWMSNDYVKHYGIDVNCLTQSAKNNEFSHDNLFHSLLGIFDVQTSEYHRELDMFEACRQ